MRILIIAAVMLISVQGTSHAQMAYGGMTCSEYLGEYSLHELSGRGTNEGPTDSGFTFHFINGVISAHNFSTKGDILGEMTINDAYRWIAAFCRDSKPNMHLLWATYQLIYHKSK